MRIRSGGRRFVIGVAVLAFAATTAVGCSDDGADVAVVDRREALDLAAGASHDAGGVGFSRTLQDGTPLGITAQYFEPLRVGDWVAADECSFNTSVEVTSGPSRWASPPFEGPASDDATVTGWLGTVVELPPPTGVPPTGVPVTTDGAVPTTSTVDPSRTAVVVAAFGHDSVATLRALPPEGAEVVDTQPLDGWTVLAVPIAAGAGATVPPLTLEVRDPSGEVRTESLELTGADASGHLVVGTPAWRFDPGQVTDACRAPEGDASNTTTTTPTDILSQPIAPIPALPAPGPAPIDPTDATASAMAAIRTMYDMADPTDDAKARVAEDPEVGARILAELRAKEVLEPYLDRLDPVFGPLVFTSPGSASVLYRVGPGYQWEVGRVVLVDGTWRVASGTICRDLADAAYTCPAGITPDPPPGPLGGQRIPGGPDASAGGR